MKACQDCKNYTESRDASWMYLSHSCTFTQGPPIFDILDGKPVKMWLKPEDARSDATLCGLSARWFVQK